MYSSDALKRPDLIPKRTLNYQLYRYALKSTNVKDKYCTGEINVAKNFNLHDRNVDELECKLLVSFYCHHSNLLFFRGIIKALNKNLRFKGAHVISMCL